MASSALLIKKRSPRLFFGQVVRLRVALQVPITSGSVITVCLDTHNSFYLSFPSHRTAYVLSTHPLWGTAFRINCIGARSNFGVQYSIQAKSMKLQQHLRNPRIHHTNISTLKNPYYLMACTVYLFSDNKCVSSDSSFCASENRHTQRRPLQTFATIAWYHGSL